jgi:virginiamycin B lyase
MRRIVRRGFPLLLVSSLVAAADAEAVLITPHPLTVPATNILGVPGGLLISSGLSGAPVNHVSTSPAFAALPGLPGPVANRVTIGPDGNPWYLGGANESVAGKEVIYPAFYELTPTSVVLRFRYPQPWGQPYAPGDFVTGPDRALWVADWGVTGAIERYEPGGGFKVYWLPGGGNPISIVSGPEDALWFTDSTGKIGRITTTGEVKEFLIEDGDTFATWGFAGPYGITVGADGALWFAEQAAGRIGRMTTTGQLREFVLPRTAASAAQSVPAPRHVAAGPEGAIWFTDPGDGSIGRVTASGEIGEYRVPSPSLGVNRGPGEEAVPDEIAIGPEGLPCFTEIGAARLDSIDPNASLPFPAKRAVARSRRQVAAANPNHPCARLLVARLGRNRRYGPTRSCWPRRSTRRIV